MTLPDALAYARAHQPSLAAARARLAAASAEARIPGTLYTPRLALGAEALVGTSNNTTASYVTLPGVDLARIGGTPVGTETWSPDPSTLVGAGLRQEVFDFGRAAALQAEANAARVAEGARADAVRLDVDLAVEDAFLAVRTAAAVLEAADAAVARSKVQRDTAAAGVRAQLRDPIELTRADADLGRFQVARLRAEAGLAAARSAFAAVVGAPSPLLDAAGEVPAPEPAPTLDDAVRQALVNDPALRERSALVAEQRATTRSLAASLRPDLSLTASVTGREGGALPSSGAEPSGGGWIPSTPNWDAGLVLTWPLLDLGVRAREEASRSREEARRAEVEERVQQIGAAVQRAYVDLVAAQQALPALEQSLAAARANWAQAKARFDAELGSSVEVADAQGLLSQAEVALAVGRYEAARARAVLRRVVAEPS
jgi:outer membrane protein